MSKRLDDLKVHGLMIYQDSDLFCFGTDAVLLADFCRRKKYNNAVDLCCGNGIIPLLLSYGCDGIIYGVEISESSVNLAKESVLYNGLYGKIDIINVDIRSINEKNTVLPLSSFDLVSVNPPYSAENSGKVAEGQRGVARTESFGLLENIIKAASRLLKSGGRFCMVNRPERLADIFYFMRKHKIEPKILQTVETAPDRKPSLVLIEGKKDAKCGLVIECSVELYDGYEYRYL